MTVKYTSEGEGAVVAGANSVSAAQDKVAASANALATATETSARRQSSATAAFDALVRRTDPAAKALFDLQKNYDLVTRALSRNQSPAMIDTANRALDAYRTKLTEAEAAQKLFFGSMSGKTIDIALKIDTTAAAGSAKASADAFMAQFGGLEGIAKSKATQIGQEFGASLDASMIAGISKSAKDSASVFSAELDRLDHIAQAKATQIGKNFQEDLNRSLNIGATPKSAAQSADVFNQTLIAQEDSVRRLRAAINPLEAEQGKLGAEMVKYKTLLQDGKITTTEYAAAQDMAGKRLSDFAQNLKQAGGAGRVMSGEMTNLGFQLNDVVTGLALGQSPFMILAQQGGQIVQIFQNARASILDFAKAALVGLTSSTAGIAALVAGAAAAILGLDHALASNGQTVEASKGRLDALGGVKMGNEYSKSLETLTKNLGVTREELQPTYESLLKLSNEMATGWSRGSLSASEAGAAIRTVFQEMKLGGADTKTATTETAAFFDDLIKKQGLTADALRKLESIAPGAANALTFAMTSGRMSVAQYAKELEKVPEPIGRIMDGLHDLTRNSDASFKRLVDNPKNATDAMEKLSRAFSSLWDKITGSDKSSDSAARVSVFTKAVSGLADGIVAATPAIVASVQFIGTVFSAVFGPVVSLLGTVGQAFQAAAPIISNTFAAIKGGYDSLISIGSGLVDSVKSTWNGIVEAISSGVNSAIASIKGFVDGVLGYLNGLLQSAIDIARQVAQAIASMGGGGGGSGSGQDGSNRQIFPLFRELLGYASGGQFTVKGPGGTDTEKVEFWASPGEVVTVTPPGGTPPPNPAIGGGSSNSGGLMAFATGGQMQIKPVDDSGMTMGEKFGKPYSAGADIVAAKFADDTIKQTSSLKEKLDQICAKIVEAITNSGVMTRNAVTEALEKIAADAKKMNAANDNISSGGSGGGAAYDPSIAPWMQGAGVGIGPKQAGGVGGSMPFGFYGGLGTSAYGFANYGGLGSSSYGLPSGGSKIPGAGGQFTGGGGFNTRSSSSGTSSFASDGTFRISSGNAYSDQGSYSPYSSGGLSSYGNGLVGGQGSAIGSGYSSNAEGYGGPVWGYANGGKFTVGGDGGIDTTSVRFNATRGEVVTIAPASAKDGNSSATSAQPREVTKTVIINVQQGVTADTFIKSRAEVARAVA